MHAYKNLKFFLFHYASSQAPYCNMFSLQDVFTFSVFLIV